jgi:hypothetical protein
MSYWIIQGYLAPRNWQRCTSKFGHLLIHFNDPNNKIQVVPKNELFNYIKTFVTLKIIK